MPLSDSTTIVLVVLFMLLSPLLTVAACALMDRHLARVARGERLEAIVDAIDAGQDFPWEWDVVTPCPECGAEWRWDFDLSKTHNWHLDHAQDCLFMEARQEQARRRALAEALDASILAQDAAQEEAEYEALIWAENEALTEDEDSYW